MIIITFSDYQVNSMADIVRILREYHIIDHINSFIGNGIVMAIAEWKKIVNDKVKDKENKE